MTNGTERLLRRLDLLRVRQPQADGVTEWQGEAGANALNLAGRLFGGFVLAQTLVAAGRTVPGRRIHSMQQSFLRGGRADQPIAYSVYPLFDGRTYAAARVEVRQGSELISHAQVGFTAGVDGGPDRTATSPARSEFADVVNRDKYRGRVGWDDQPVEIRANIDHENDSEPTFDTWLRPVGPIPDDQLLHQAVLAFASDRVFMSVSWMPHREQWGSGQGSTLDHSLWFHRPVRFDDWHVFAMHSPAMTDGRGLSLGMIHRADGESNGPGELVVSVAQQGTFRPPRKS